jgi:hypothetical protein
MSQEKKYFNISQMVFWVLIILLIILSIVKSDLGLFNEQQLSRRYLLDDSLNQIALQEEQEREEAEKEEENQEPNSVIKRTWKWESFDGKTYTLVFTIPKKAYESAKQTRLKSPPNEGCWRNMFRHDREGLKDMVEGYRNIIQEQKLDYRTAMQMVVSSAQNFDYTYITNEQEPCRNIRDGNGQKPTEDCKPKPYPYGCCDNVAPWAVYSPLEYAVNGAGDCDTKSLFAMTILKYLNMGFDAEMLMGDVELGRHAMLGVCVPNPPHRNLSVRDMRSGKRYYAWECTQRNNASELGAPVWQMFKNWEVVPIR